MHDTGPAWRPQCAMTRLPPRIAPSASCLQIRERSINFGSTSTERMPASELEWSRRYFPAIVDAALKLKPMSFLIDGEAVIARDDGAPDFRALFSNLIRDAVLYAFDLIEQDGYNLRELPLIVRNGGLRS